MGRVDVARGSEGIGLDTAVWREVGSAGALGEPEAHPAGLSFDRLRHLYRLMAVGRRIDHQAITLTRQGFLGVYSSSLGQEACQVGPVLALEERDWLFPTYRDMVAVFARGVDPVEILALYEGRRHNGYDPMRHRVAPLSVPLATHAPHAVGLAMAARQRGDPVVALVLLGDGATSEGDAHEAFNMAGVYAAPCVFLVQNNQYAISVPLRLQTHASAIALRAAGYGIHGIQVDGNDAVSVHVATRAALARARAGDGPSLVEALTYRLEAHTTADDQTRYRSAEEVEHWRERDPLPRLATRLREAGVIDSGFSAEVAAEAEALAARMRSALQAAPPPAPLSMFDHVYASAPDLLRRQRAELAAILEAERESGR
jgi:2-oxoisovalerate dehydrogenase E1 component alpha subunit